jgi:hypothetical protein
LLEAAGCGLAVDPVNSTALDAANASTSETSSGSGSGAGSTKGAAPTVTASISGTPPTTAIVGSVYQFQPGASDNNGGALSFTVSNLPAWLYFNAESGQLSGMPSANDVGTSAPITITVDDGTATASLSPFQIVVSTMGGSAPAPVPPTISGTPPSSVVAGMLYSFQPSASGPSGDSLTFSITGQPAWASFNASSGLLSGTPPNNSIGTFANIVISVSDGQASASLPAFSIAVVPSPPTISGSPPTSVVAGTAYTFTPTASDPTTGLTLTFSVQNLPSWATFSATTGQISGTPASSAVGAYSGILISVSNGTNSTSLAPFTITVTAPQSTSGSATLTWAAPTTNTDGSALSDLTGYTINYGNTAASLSQAITVSGSATTSYTVQNLASGTWYFEVSANASDGTQSAPTAVGSKTIP